MGFSETLGKICVTQHTAVRMGRLQVTMLAKIDSKMANGLQLRSFHYKAAAKQGLVALYSFLIAKLFSFFCLFLYK